MSASLCFWFLYFSLYWPYRDLFNEDGRYFDERTSAVYHAQSSWLLLPALAFLMLAAGLGAAWRMRRRAGHGVAS